MVSYLYLVGLRSLKFYPSLHLLLFNVRLLCPGAFHRDQHSLFGEMHVRIQRGGGDRGSGPTLKNHKNIGFSSHTGPDPLNIHSYQDSIQCWTIVGTPAKRHLMAFCWWAEDGQLKVVLGSSLHSSNKKKNIVKVGPPLTFNGVSLAGQ